MHQKLFGGPNREQTCPLAEFVGHSVV